MSSRLVGTGAAGIAGLFVRAGGSCSPDHRDPEFGTMVGTDPLYLIPDSYSARGISIPPHETSPGGYRTLSGFRSDVLTTASTTVADHGGHVHAVPDVDQATSVDLLAGDRVLLVWVAQTPVVLGRI